MLVAEVGRVATTHLPASPATPTTATASQTGACITVKSVLPRLLAAATLALAAVVPAVSLAPPASAHDQVVSTSPADGASVAALTKVSVSFSEPVLDVASANRIVVTGPDGAVSGELTTADKVITYTFASPLPGGAYRVQWRAASSDGHPVSGTFSFTVKAAATTPPMSTATAAGTPTASASVTATPLATTPATTQATTAPADQPASSSSSWGPWLLGALVLAALAATALIVSAKRRAGDEGPQP